ncbi:MAG: RNA 2',3'-cyclic phosphodiesterase [Campylobacterales bacterium]|nr:RNA 2',3'-cyclic phosphodiesterase [Campylobacterales bacterium]
MRVFLCSFATSNIYQNLKNDISIYFDGNFPTLQNLHVTQYFFGDIDKQMLLDIIEILDNFDFKQEHCTIKSLGSFGTIPKVIFGNVYNTKEFQRVNNFITSKISKTSNLYKPHLTLLRVKKIKNQNYHELFKKYEDVEIAQTSQKYSLVESTLTQNGAIYKTIKSYL